MKLVQILNEIKIIAPPDAVGTTINGETKQFYYEKSEIWGWRLNVDESNLKTLRIINKSKLERLDCDINYLEQLDLSNCINLRRLYCFNNNLTELDLENCPQLKILKCKDNNLTKLNISNCPNLDINSLHYDRYKTKLIQ
jgi:hypothetical protein